MRSLGSIARRGGPRWATLGRAIAAVTCLLVGLGVVSPLRASPDDPPTTTEVPTAGEPTTESRPTTRTRTPRRTSPTSTSSRTRTSSRTPTRTSSRTSSSTAQRSTRASSTRSRTRPTKARTTTRRRTPAERRDAEDAAETSSVSVGHTNRGRLIRGHELVNSANVVVRSRGHQFGTDELVSLLERSAATVATAFPGGQLTVGSLSARYGGAVSPHRSHRSGRDVDIGFYVLDTAGQPAPTQGFVSFRGDGHSREHPELVFDDARNWALIAALLDDTAAPVQFIFVSRELRTRLVAEGRRQGAREELIERVETVVDQPSRGSPHRDHFHVRIYCPLDDVPRCIDEPPLHPWLARRALHAPVRTRRASRASTSSRTRARRSAAREASAP